MYNYGHDPYKSPTGCDAAIPRMDFIRNGG